MSGRRPGGALFWRLALPLLLAVPAWSTILVFDQCGGDPNAAIRGSCSGGTVNPDYGDRAAGVSEDGGLFRYIEDGEGWTPNVQTGYGPDESAIYGYSTGYSPLANVLWADRRVGVLEITLQADPGYRVLLYNFEMALFSASASSLDIGRIRVIDQDGVPLLDLVNHILRDAETFFFFTPARSGPGGFLRIQFDVTNLPLGEAREYVAIDNIRLGQQEDPVPEPHAWILCLSGAALPAIRTAILRTGPLGGQNRDVTGHKSGE